MTVHKIIFSLFLIFALFSLSTPTILEIPSGIAHAYDDEDGSGGDDPGYGGDENYDDGPPGSDNPGNGGGGDDDPTNCSAGGFNCGGDGGDTGPSATQREALDAIREYENNNTELANAAKSQKDDASNTFNKAITSNGTVDQKVNNIHAAEENSNTNLNQTNSNSAAVQNLQQAELHSRNHQEESQSTQQTDSNEANQNTQGVRGGDPVILASGIEDFKRVDLAYKSLLDTIEIQRRYLSSGSDRLSSSGYGWFFNYDTCIVVGRKPLIRERELLTAQLKDQAFALMNQVAAVLAGTEDSLVSASQDALIIDQETAKMLEYANQIRALRDQVLSAADEAETAADAADAKAVIAALPEADTLAAGTRQSAVTIRQYADETVGLADSAGSMHAASVSVQAEAWQSVSNIEGHIAEIQIIYAAIAQTYQQLAQAAEQARAEARAEEERFPLDPYPEDSSVYFGAGYLKLIDEGGIPILFKENSEGVFTPVTDNGSYTDTIVAVEGGYLKATKHGDTQFFADPGDGIALLSSITDRNGNTISFVRANGQLETIVDATGRKIQIQYNDQGFISTVVDPAGLYYEYEYENDLLVTYIDPEGSFWSYGYDESRHLISRTDPLGHTHLYRYDELGRVMEETDKAGHATAYAYDPGNRQTTVTDRRGLATVYHYNENHRLVQTDYPDGASTRIDYDHRNNPTSVIDENGNTTSFTYDNQNNVTSVVNALGEQWQYTYDQTFNQLTSEIDPLGRTRSFTYDGSGNLIRIDHPDGSAETRSYDHRGLIASATNANGNTTEFDNDELGHPVAVTHADGTTRFASYDRLGRVLSATDENDATTEYTYNNVGKVTSVTDPLGAVTTFLYDARHLPEQVVNAKGDAVTTTHTPNGKVKVVKDPLGNCTTYDYDAADNLISETKPNNTGIDFKLDQRGRILSQTTFPGNLETTYTYDPAGRQTSVTDANGNTKQYEYDPLGRVIAETNALGNRVYSEYGPTGKLTVFTDANGHSRTYEYDDMDRQSRITDALGNTTDFVHDPVGNLIVKTLADGSRIDYQYDSRNRMTNTAYPDGTYKAFEYDPAGRLIRLENDLTSETRQYDLVGRLLSTHDSSSNKTITYAYDILGNRSYMKDPDRGEYAYEYDANSNLESFTDPKGLATDYVYDELNRLTQAIYPNHTATIWEYDLNNRLQKVENLNNRDQSFATSAYTYDDAGNRLTQTDENGLVTRYEYDAAYQLISVGYFEMQPRNKVDYYQREVLVGQQAYTYDPAGNRLSKKEDGQALDYEYNSANQMLAAGDTTFTYDANGNRVGKHDGQSDIFYEYNYENLLTKVSTPEKDTTYGYDSLNRRIFKKSSRWNNVRYIYDGLDVIQEVIGYRYHERVTTYYRANGMIVASQRYVTNGASYHFGIHRPRSLSTFYAYDGLGSVAALSNFRGWSGTGSRYEYDAFGSLREGSLKKNPYGFTGKRFDAESGLYHFHFRKYDPTTGVWTTPDPIDIVGGLNLYAYVANNPIIFIDPWGLCADTGFWDAAGAIGRGILIAGQGTWNALGSEQLLKGVEFGFKAAGRVNLEAIDFVYHDVRNAVIISYGGQLIRFPTAGSYAVGLSANAINTTIDVVRFQEVAQDVSSDINAIRKDVFDR